MTSDLPRVLLVDPCEALNGLKPALQAQGYEVISTPSGRIGLCLVGAQAIIILLVDFEALDLDWRDFIATARDLSRAPIIGLSTSGDRTERIEALDLGASDVLVKPFDQAELLARLRAAMRLYGAAARPAVAPEAPPDRLKLDVTTRSAIVDGRVVRLSRRECAVLHILVEAAGSEVGFEEIIQKVWNRQIEADAQRVRVLIWQLRRKVEPDPTRPCFIISEPGRGYRLNAAGLGWVKTPEPSH